MITYRNTIELNGKSSTEIKGLLIQSLPPITKPAIRTQVEEIDGRDGDIVTKLGYSAYDKQVLIGLYGDFEIDDIIEFFNSEGVVTFSNEPDKYYHYEIVNQIDFDRLIRFRTATVAFHVQPFKFSTIELEKSFDTVENLLSIPDYTATSNGITLTAKDGNISVKGTGTKATEFYLPLAGRTLAPGDYTLTATTSGTGASATSIRLIGSAPSDADSFGGKYITLADGTVTLQDTLTVAKQYNYLWFYVNAGTALDFTMTGDVQSDVTLPITIRNNGNYYSRPTITVYGTGTINLNLNGQQLFNIELGEELTHLTIDATIMEAYQDTPDTLMNRYVDGNYDNLKLDPGANTITWTGELTQIKINNYSRWL